MSKNNTKTCWVLKCDIKKFFTNIDHNILLEILNEYIPDKNIILLLENIIGSFQVKNGVGLPLGNLTSQLLVNIYMNKFDQFMKHEIKAKYYIRYADDFVVFHEDKLYLEGLVTEIDIFLQSKLSLQLHPKKVFIKTLDSGVDFLGWVNFSHYRVLRTSTKRRMMRNLNNNSKPETVASYFGMLSHGDLHNLSAWIKKYVLPDGLEPSTPTL